MPDVNTLLIEVEDDPEGFAPRPDLFARNLSRNTITANIGLLRWELPPAPNPDFEQPLPWTVARSTGFERIWERGQVAVAIDPDFEFIIDELPVGGSVFRPIVHRQTDPLSTVDINHGFDRNGPVMAVVFSLDGLTEYYNFTMVPLDKNNVRLSFDDPITFVATVF